MGFREAILLFIEKQLCDNLIIDEPDVPFQNQIAGYEDLNRLRDIGSNTALAAIGTNTYDETSYLAPRRSNGHFSTPLRRLYCRPIKNSDVTGILGSIGTFDDKNPIFKTPSAFLHINGGEKDLYWPQRTRPAETRLGYQVEYLRVNIDCVFRDLSEPQPELPMRPTVNDGEMPKSWLGNGQYWEDQKKLCNVIQPININGLTGLPSDYQPEYHKTINQLATGFVQDLESLLDPSDIRTRSDTPSGMPPQPGQAFTFGEMGKYQADVRNVNLPRWGMLPDAENSPTDTIRCIFDLEIHYPKIYSLG